MNSDLNKYTKYIVQGIVVFSLFKYIPKAPMENRDILILALIVILASIVFDNVYNMMSPKVVPSCSLPKPTPLEYLDGSISSTVSPPTPSVRTSAESVGTRAEYVGSRAADGVMSNEMQYNYADFNTMPFTNTGTFEAGYSFLPPEKWYPTPQNPPVCVVEKQCPVCPVYTEGTNIDLKYWDDSRRITPPDNINTKYIEEKLNSGR
jgi:hypothetical protein